MKNASAPAAAVAAEEVEGAAWEEAEDAWDGVEPLAVAHMLGMLQAVIRSDLVAAAAGQWGLLSDSALAPTALVAADI